LHFSDPGITTSAKRDSDRTVCVRFSRSEGVNTTSSVTGHLNIPLSIQGEEEVRWFPEQLEIKPTSTITVSPARLTARPSGGESIVSFMVHDERGMRSDLIGKFGFSIV